MEQATHIPLIVAGPGIVKGRATDQLAETVDIYPTLAALAALPAPTCPQPIDGTSLAPVLHDPATRVRGYAYHAYPRPGRPGQALRTQRYRLVRWKIGSAACRIECVRSGRYRGSRKPKKKKH